jgi:predicted AAA+ superfamily ATPase
MVRRKKHITILKHLSKKEFTVLIGPRQIGKSTMLKQLNEDLRQKGEITYFLNLDSKDILDDLNLNPENLFKICPLSPNKKIEV